MRDNMITRSGCFDEQCSRKERLVVLTWLPYDPVSRLDA